MRSLPGLRLRNQTTTPKLRGQVTPQPLLTKKPKSCISFKPGRRVIRSQRKVIPVPETSTYINRELSWLSFNARVLQEGNDPSVPLIERIKFLGIFSSNLDEFFKVRVATLKRLVKLGEKGTALIDDNPEQTLNAIQEVVARQQQQFEEVYKQLVQELEAAQICIVEKEDLSPSQMEFVQAYYQQKVRPALVPLMIDQFTKFPPLQEDALYLAVQLQKNTKTKTVKYALAEVPAKELSRFVVLPAEDGKTKIMLLEDLIRYGLQDIFSIFKKFRYTVREAFPIKITKDAELDIDDDVTQSFIEKISKSVKRRTKGQPVRLTYDKRLSEDSLQFLSQRLKLSKHDTILPEGRYLNFKDFIKFPKIGAAKLQYPPHLPLPHKAIDPQQSLLKTIRKKDILLHYPYQSFHYMIDLLREAAIDPHVTSIRMTLYRVAEMSKIVNALSKASKNGKAVTALFEFQARFDEAANIYWANQLIEDGVRVIQGIPGLKVHAKLCIIARKERGKSVRYAAIGTGNFNEDTAKLYGDHTLLTADERLTTDVRNLFSFLRTNYKVKSYDHLIVSPFFMRDAWKELIDTEITHAQEGKDAYIDIKLNSLVDRDMIALLYQASQAGVRIRLIVRGICSLVPGVPGLSENIEAISIVDKFLEHSRILIFCNNGKEKYYIGSADWMTRNLDHRVEAACPIYAKNLQKELRTYFDLQWKDNVK
ncbi:polyphosphate kinase 1, partial [candidate division KSB3 bacterium]|nr:polyphosphate kinase 1 [candidate division KSB3 bacterium]